MGGTREPESRKPVPGPADPADAADADGEVSVIRLDEAVSETRAHQIIEEFESESPTRQVGGLWRWLAAVLAAGLSVYALYWTQYSVATHAYRASFLFVVLVLTFLL